MQGKHEATTKLLGRTNYSVGIIVILVGLLLKSTYLLWETFHFPKNEFFKNAVNEVGGFLIVTFLLAFFYELIIREDHQRKLQIELDSELKKHFSQAKTDYQSYLRLELDRVAGSHLNAHVHNLYPGGRVSIEKKIEHIRNAKSEIVELGTALNTFKNYFEGTSDFKDAIEDRLMNGVNLICLMLDPDYAGNLDVCNNNSEDESLKTKIIATQKRLWTIKQEFDRKGYSGKMKIYCYQHLPCFAAIMVDCNIQSANTGMPAEEGSLFFSPYLYFEPNRVAPTIEIHINESRELFSKLRISAHKVFANSKEMNVPTK